MRKNKGFTLIELLVVIAIIAILAAILFPVFARAREKARQTSCLNNVKQLDLAMKQYGQDADERFPLAVSYVGASDIGPVSANTGAQGWILPDILHSYTQNSAIWVDPSAAGYDRMGVATRYSYGYNVVLCAYGQGATRAAVAPDEDLSAGILSSVNAALQSPASEATIKNPSGTIYLVDAGTIKNKSAAPTKWLDTAGTYGAVFFPTRCADTKCATGVAEKSYTSTNQVSPRHNGMAVCGFIDGHAKAIAGIGIVGKSAGEAGCLYDNGAN